MRDVEMKHQAERFSGMAQETTAVSFIAKETDNLRKQL
jgi:hypothetical protein